MHNHEYQSVSAVDPDWSRESPRRWWDPARQLIRSIRCYQRSHSLKGLRRWTLRIVSALKHRFWSIVTAADIPLDSQLGGGFLLVHPNGVVIHPGAVFGPNCLVFQQVTVVGGVTIGGHVDIGAGTKIIRQVCIGDNAKIGANAVVLCDVPAGSTAVGVPARLVFR